MELSNLIKSCLLSFDDKDTGPWHSLRYPAILIIAVMLASATKDSFNTASANWIARSKILGSLFHYHTRASCLVLEQTLD